MSGNNIDNVPKRCQIKNNEINLNWHLATPADNSSSYSFLNSEPNNNNTNNNNTRFDLSAYPANMPNQDNLNNFELADDLTGAKSSSSRPLTFWILHLFSVEGCNELTSETVRKLLETRYGLNCSDATISKTLERLAKRGVLRRRRPFAVHAGGHGGLRRVYYYSYVSLDKLCEAMATYDESYSLRNVKNTGEDFFREKLLEALYGILEVLTRIEAKMR